MLSDEEDYTFVTQNTFRSSPVQLDYCTTGVYETLLLPEFSDISDSEHQPSMYQEPQFEKKPVQVADENETTQLVKLNSQLTPPRGTVQAAAPKERFGSPIRDEVLSRLQSKRFADSTTNKIKWAIKTFKEWQHARNCVAPSLDWSPILVNMENMSKDELNYCISRFLCEVRKVDSSEYPPDTLYSFVICIQLYMDTLEKHSKFLIDDSFSQIRNTLDNLMKEKSSSFPPRRQAQIITLEEEELLWTESILGSENPRQLLYTLMYVIGLNFALRGGQEHRNLRRGSRSQFVVRQSLNGRFLQYTEDNSKTSNRGLKHRRIEPKCVVAYENTITPKRCIVKLYEKYCSCCPPSSESEAFYLRPLDKPNGNVWYLRQPLGRHTLAGVVAAICKQGSLVFF